MNLVDFEPLPIEQNEANKAIYAYFGLAMYHAQILEHGLVNALFCLDFFPTNVKNKHTKKSWEEAVDNYFDDRFKCLLSHLINKISEFSVFPKSILFKLKEAVKVRNRLAHVFFREHDVSWFSCIGMELMHRELLCASNLFIEVTNEVDAFIKPYQDGLGISDEYVNQKISEILKSGVEPN